MSNNKLAFIKNYNLLYVEDDESTRKPLQSILEKFFNIVIVGCDGKDGYEKYCEFTQSGKDIHIIISDINMPIKNGLSMISDIRKLNHNVPCILLTAYNEPEFMLEAIKLGVSRYVFKPVQVPDLMKHVEEICEQKYNKENNEKLLVSHNELKQYIDTVNQVAIISKTDPAGIITYVNDIFCEISGYSQDELIGQKHNIIRHPDMPKETFKNLWDTISEGVTWRGKIKNLAKDGNAYYVDAHIFPLYHDDQTTLKGYMGVRFLTTELEMEKRIFKQKVIQNVVQYKNSISHYESSVTELQNQIQALQKKIELAENVDMVYEKLNVEKTKIKTLQKKLFEYEETIKYLKEQLKLYSIDNIKELEFTIRHKDSLISGLQKRLDIYQKKFYDLQEKIEDQERTIKDLAKQIRFYQTQSK